MLGLHALSLSRPSAHEPAQQRGRVVAVLLHDPAGRSGFPARIARTSAACWRSEWAMLVSSTGIASSISCSVACTEVTASTVRGESVSEATVRWKRESACRCCGRLARRGHVGVRLLELGGRDVVETARGGQVRPRRARRSGGTPARPASPGAGPAVIRAAARADGVPGLRVTTVPPPRPRVVSTSPAWRSAAIASRSVARETCSRSARSRSAGSVAAARVDAEPDRGRQLLHARLERVVPAHRPQHRLGEVAGRGRRSRGHPSGVGQACQSTAMV